MKEIYIATHGEMSIGIKDSLRLIAGESADQITAYSLKPGENAQDFILKIEERLINYPEKQIIILGDLYGASIVNNMFSLARYENAVLLSGVNLSMALQILLDGSKWLDNETINFIIEESKIGIKRLEMITEEITSEEF